MRTRHRTRGRVAAIAALAAVVLLLGVGWALYTRNDDASKAQAAAKRYLGAWSGGSEPGNEVNPAAIEAMAERGIDITHAYPKPWTDEVVRAADVVITMGCGDA